jgi:hypothetical protein
MFGGGLNESIGAADDAEPLGETIAGGLGGRLS